MSKRTRGGTGTHDKTGGNGSNMILPVKTLVLPGDPLELYPIPPDEDFEGLEFFDAPDLERIAKALIEKYDDKFYFLNDARIRYYWKLKGGVSGNRAVFGKCVKPSGLLRHVTQDDYVIWAAADNCREAQYTRFHTEALTFHELRHTALAEKEKLSTQGHEFEGFVDEFKIYGAWRPVMEQIVGVARLLPFEE